MAIRFETKKVASYLIDRAWARIAQKPENLNRRDEFWPCIVCGLPIDGQKAKWIHVIDGGCRAAEDGDEIDPGGDMYWHPIGPDCLRRQPQLKPVAKSRREEF
jgi:hypothetical protein